jgi:uncharacterized phage protein gp47/JayE
MAYFEPYIDEAGLHIPTYIDIRDDLVAKFRGIYGEDLYLENDSQDYQMISAFSLKTADTMKLLQLVWNNHSPKTATGTALSSLVKLNGIKRKVASHSTCILTLTGKKGTIIRHGRVKDSAGFLWELPDSVLMTEDEVDVSAKCMTIGSVEAPPGTITKIDTPQAGWIAVTNNVPAVVGAPVETDVELRARQSISVAIPSRNMLDSTIAGIASIPGVKRYKVYDNDTNVPDENGIPGHSIAAVVEGGLDDEIGAQIFLRKGTGGGTYGTTTVIYKSADDLEYKVHFSRPHYRKINILVKVTPCVGYTNELGESVKKNLQAYIDGLGIGSDVSLTGALVAVAAAIQTPVMPPFSLKSLTIGTDGSSLGTADVAIAYNEIATSGNIEIETGG